MAAGHVTDISPFFSPAILLFCDITPSVCLCFPATGVCEPASPPRGEGIRRPADEEQLLLQEPETREGGRKDPQAVGRTEGSVCGDGNKNSLTSPDNKNNSRFVWLVVKYRGKKVIYFTICEHESGCRKPQICSGKQPSIFIQTVQIWIKKGLDLFIYSFSECFFIIFLSFSSHNINLTDAVKDLLGKKLKKHDKYQNQTHDLSFLISLMIQSRDVNISQTIKD